MSSFVRSCVIRLAVCALSPLAAFGQSLDLSFNPGANAEVFALAAQPDGKILVGGNVTIIAGTSRPYLSRVNVDGSLDAAFAPAIGGTVNALALQPDGKILVGGGFTSAGGSSARTRLVRLNANGTVDPSFSANAGGTVSTIRVQPDGRLLVGGFFTEMGGASHPGIARLNADGSVDASFTGSVTGSLFAGVNPWVASLAVQADGKILVVGSFSTVGGQPRSAIARLNPDGSLDTTFTCNASSDAQAVFVQPDGKIVVAGSFTTLAGLARVRIARLNSSGTPEAAFAGSIDSGIRVAALQADGKIVVGGTFTSIAGATRNRLARFDADGSLDASFNPDVTGTVGGSTPGIYALILNGPGQIIFGGAMGSVGGQPRPGLARLGLPVPILTAPPSALTAVAGSTATLSVTAAGSGLLYQWQRNGADLPGATTRTLALANLAANQAGNYTVTVTNSFGSSTTAPALVTVGSPSAVAYTFAPLAGRPGQPGTTDGPAATAQFNSPRGLAVDVSGNLFVADSANHTIRKIAPDGTVSTFAGSTNFGALDGLGAAARFTNPTALAIVADTGLMVADTSNFTLRKITPNGVVSTFAGEARVRGADDGPAILAHFGAPSGLAIDSAGIAYVADVGNSTVRRVSTTGSVTTLAGTSGQIGTADATGPAARFNTPQALALDSAGQLYVADTQSHTLRRLTPAGVTTTVAGTPGASGASDGAGPAARFNAPAALAVDPAGRLVVCDQGNHTLRLVSTSGLVSTLAGSPGLAGTTDGNGVDARFSSPAGLAFDRSGNLYLADTGNHLIRKGTPTTSPLGLLASPVAVQAAATTSATLTVSAVGASLTYQWKKDGIVLAGATSPSLTFARSVVDDSGDYRVTVTSAGSSVESALARLTITPTGTPGRLINVSTRGFVPAGESLTPGFVLRGTGGKPLVVRAVGPTLIRFGLVGALADPRMDLVPLAGTVPLLTNDDWGTNANLAALLAATGTVGGFALDEGSKDAAALTTLSSAGTTGYTVRITGPTASASGIAIAEIYDTEPATSAVQLVNVSTRGFVGVGANALVAGFVLGGDNPKQLLIRAVGPGLAPFGLTGLLADPLLTVTPLGQDTPVAANDNWGNAADLAAAFSAVGAFGLPAGSKDAAVLVRLPPGGYTVTVSGLANTTGTALVEIYDVP